MEHYNHSHGNSQQDSQLASHPTCSFSQRLKIFWFVRRTIFTHFLSFQSPIVRPLYASTRFGYPAGLYQTSGSRPVKVRRIRQ